MPRVRANGIDLYYEDAGEGTPILCIHGTSGSALQWAGAAAEYSLRARCITYDRRGCFRSERPEPYDSTDMSDHADDAAGLLDALSASPAVIVGRSYGGGVALDVARRYPAKVIALALLEPAVDSLSPDAPEWSRFVGAILDTQKREPTMVGETFIRGVAGDAAWDSFPAEVKDSMRANGPAIAAELRGNMVDFTLDGLAGLRHPTLVVGGKDSPDEFRRPLEILADALPNCELLFVEGGHVVDPTHPAIVSFIDRAVELRRPPLPS